MQRVGGSERNLPKAQEELLSPTVNGPGQLDALIASAVEALEDRVLHPPRNLQRAGALTQPTGESRCHFGHDKVRDEDVFSSLQHTVEVIAPRL